MGASIANAGYIRSGAFPTRSKILLCRRKFLRFFPEGFRDETYFDWERGYKWRAHQEWHSVLNRKAFQANLSKGKFLEIGSDAVRIESRTNLLFSFEKMAIRDALKSERGARAFAEGLYALLYGPGTLPAKFTRWCNVVGALPRKQSRVLTWPIWQPYSDSLLNPKLISSLNPPSPAWPPNNTVSTFGTDPGRRGIHIPVFWSLLTKSNTTSQTFVLAI